MTCKGTKWFKLKNQTETLKSKVKWNCDTHIIQSYIYNQPSEGDCNVVMKLGLTTLLKQQKIPSNAEQRGANR